MEPPYTEPYVRWWERTGKEIILTFLLDLKFYRFSREILVLCDHRDPYSGATFRPTNYNFYEYEFRDCKF